MKTEHDQVNDLAMLVRRLSRFAPPQLAYQATAYLRRYNLLGSPLREPTPLSAEDTAVVEQYLKDVTCPECHCPKHMHRPGCPASNPEVPND